MPAIEPARLAREVERLVAHFTFPEDLGRTTLEVLEFYAQRARRPGDRRALSEGTQSLDVPAPVLRALGAGLRGGAQRSPQSILPVAETLWAAPVREMRLLACWVWSASSGPDGAAWFEAHASALDDPAILQAAVDRGLSAWRACDGPGYVAQLDRWIASPHSTLQALGLKALEAGLDLRQLDDLQHAFRALTGLPRPVRGEARHALQSILCRLAERSPAETTRFLLEEIERQVPGVERLARAVADCLPTAPRERVLAALGGKSPTGGRG